MDCKAHFNVIALALAAFLGGYVLNSVRGFGQGVA